MITWNIFIWFGVTAIILATAGATAALCANDHWAACSVKYRQRRTIAVSLTVAAVAVMTAFIIGLWITLQRPPLRTMGETRLWYSFFALISGLLTYLRWRYKWILSYSTVLAAVFIIINIAKPQIHDQSLMPALQSVWFIPHVTVYMFSYSLLGCAFLLALVGLIRPGADVFPAMDTLVYVGLAFLTFGMLSGALWAKEVWGHYWSWDPKETWAAITWLMYLFYIHLRLTGRTSRVTLCILMIFAFACLQMCWWGVNYLPSAQNSVHVYNK